VRWGTHRLEPGGFKIRDWDFVVLQRNYRSHPLRVLCNVLQACYVSQGARDFLTSWEPGHQFCVYSEKCNLVLMINALRVGWGQDMSMDKNARGHFVESFMDGPIISIVRGWHESQERRLASCHCKQRSQIGGGLGCAIYITHRICPSHPAFSEGGSEA
jgi:hypothetical protein